MNNSILSQTLFLMKAALTKAATMTMLIVLQPCSSTAKDIVWYDGSAPVAYRICEKPSPVVEIALEMFEDDMAAVTGHKAHARKTAIVEIFQLDRLTNKEMKELDKRKIKYTDIITRQDAFTISTYNGKIVIIGSNGRGTAYGILELSRMAGVSPWTDWGDIIPERKSTLSLPDGFLTRQWPSVEYRGVFINDEDWSSRVWAKNISGKHAKDGEMGPPFYRRLFTLLLRLRANAFWPAMHEGTTAFFKVKGNRELADSCDMVVGTSHCEPMLRNNVGEWDEKKRGAFNFITNRHNVTEYWSERLRETASMDALYTIGMRGIHDGSMQGVKTAEEKLNGLQSVIDEQRKLMHKHLGRKSADIPQVFVPYKEVLEIYENGLRVPDDVTLMWCDDNYGYLTRLSDSLQQKRSGGAGVYYHLSYWGRPHDYLWLTTTQPGLICNEMKTAYDHNARRLWILNVHDPKVAAYGMSLFLDMAWNINCVSPSTVGNHLHAWLAQQFGQAAASKLLPAMKSFYRLCGIRRPEFMGWSQVELDKKKYNRGLSPMSDTEFAADEFGNELERYLNSYEDIKAQVAEAEKLIRPELADAFFAAIKYPVFSAAAMATKTLQAQEARHIGRPDSFNSDEEALDAALRSYNAYQEILSLTEYYNNRMSGGRWRGSMSCAPRKLPVFGEPLFPAPLSEDNKNSHAAAAPIEAKLQTDGCIVRNACQWHSASAGAYVVDLLGHSNKAVALPKGESLTYQINTTRTDSCVLRIAAIPTQPNDKGDLRYSVTIDGGAPTTFSLKEKFRSEGWKQNVLRGQAIRTIDTKLNAGPHTITITALDDHIIIDQWMIDYKPDRQFYMFPIEMQTGNSTGKQ